MAVVTAAEQHPQSNLGPEEEEEGIEIRTDDDELLMFDHLEEGESESNESAVEPRPSSFSFGRWTLTWAAVGILFTLCVILLAGGTYGVVATKNQEAKKSIMLSAAITDDDCDGDVARRYLDGEDDDGYGALGGYDQNQRRLDDDDDSTSSKSGKCKSSKSKASKSDDGGDDSSKSDDGGDDSSKSDDGGEDDDSPQDD
jgi:hypothetical protein